MNVRFLDYSDDVIEFILSQIDFSRLDRYLIVFPGNRPKLFLLKRIAEKLNRPFEPPTILSFEDFIRFIAGNTGENYNIASETELLNILYNLNLKDNNLYTRHKSHLSRFLPFAQKLIQDYSVIIKADCQIRLKNEREKILEGIEKTDLYNTVTDYIDIICKLNDSLEKNSRISDASLFRIASGLDESKLNGIISKYEKIFLIDIIPLFLSEYRLLDSLKNNSRVDFIYQKSQYLKHFKYICELIDIKKIKFDFVTKEINVFESPDIHGQILALKDILFKQNKDKRFESPDTLIMLPESETLRILTNLILNELDSNDFNVSIGIPLSSMQMTKYFNIIFELLSESNTNLEDIRAPLLYTLLSHEYTQSLRDKDKNNLYAIKESLYELLSKKVYEYISIDELSEFKWANPLLSEFINEIIKKSFDIKTIGDLAKYICNVINFIDKNQNGALNYGYFNIEAAKIHQRFREISQSEIKDISVTPKEFASVFNNFVYPLQVRPEGSPLSGLQVLGVYESRALRFKNVYILDFNDESFFDYSYEDSFLPYKVRNILGLPSKSDYDNYILYFLDILFAQGENINLFYKSSDRYSKNRYLLRYTFEKKKKGERLKPVPVFYNLNLSTPYMEPIYKSQEMINKIIKDGISATKLNTYLNCPKKFYYEAVLKLSEREEVGDEAEGSVFGEILHKTFEKYFNEYKGNKCKEIDKNKVFGILKENFKNKVNFKSKKYLFDYAMLEVILENFINKYEENELLNNGKIHYTESHLEVYSSIGKQKIRCKGRVDRIDILDDGTIHIIDYKFAKRDHYKTVSQEVTTTKLKIKDEKELIELIQMREEYVKKNNNIQLPFYIYLAQNDKELSKKAKDFKATFLFLKNTDEDFIDTIPIKPKTESKGKNNKNNEEEVLKLDDYITIVESLISEILNPDVPFFPLETKSCDYCDFFSLCHRNETENNNLFL